MYIKDAFIFIIKYQQFKYLIIFKKLIKPFCQIPDKKK